MKIILDQCDNQQLDVFIKEFKALEDHVLKAMTEKISTINSQ